MTGMTAANGRSPRIGSAPVHGSMIPVSAPFRLTDGKHRLRALLLCALFVFSLFAARLVDLQVVPR